MTENEGSTPVEQVGAEIGERLKEERTRLGHSQVGFALKVGVSKTTQFNYESGERSPDALYLHSAQKLGMDVDYVITGARTQATSDDGFVEVRYLDVKAGAGTGVVNEEQATYQVPGMCVSRDWLRQKRLSDRSLSVIRVKGHSMEGVLSDGDPVLVDTSDTEPRTGFVYVIRQGAELLVKYCQLIPGGVLRLMSANANFPPYEVDLNKSDDVQIVGRVVASMHEW